MCVDVEHVRNVEVHPGVVETRQCTSDKDKRNRRQCMYLTSGHHTCKQVE